MAIDDLVALIHGDAPLPESRDAAIATMLQPLLGSPRGRYPEQAARAVDMRAPQMRAEGSVPFAAFLHGDAPSAGQYSGMSIAIFPAPGAPCLLTFVIGTAGLHPDEEILGRPGHARKLQAITAWLNERFGDGEMIAWSKQDPVRVDEDLPETVMRRFSAHAAALKRYGRELYAIFQPTDDRAATLLALKAFIDLMFEERGYQPLAAATPDVDAIRAAWFAHLLPSLPLDDVLDLLRTRHYVVIQGPPGTGKTRMAHELLRDAYGGHGTTVQFHPNTTYEHFVGGLAPVRTGESLGLTFAPLPGYLMRAAEAAASDPSRDYLLVIDEMNRADLSKILGEAIYLFEPGEVRSLDLPYDFGGATGSRLSLPPNLHVLGTMNSADRSLAIIDIAVRRRFAFTKLWPQSDVVERLGCTLMQRAFRDLLDIFIQHAPADAFDLVPGHSYFLEQDDARARRQLKVTVAPLLEEYLSTGFVGGFAGPIRSYLQWLASL